MDRRRPTSGLLLVTVALATTLAGCASPGSTAPARTTASVSPTASPASTATVDAAVVAGARTLDVTVSGFATTVSTRLLAGTYLVHVRTTDRSNGVQVVRPPANLTRTSFIARWKAWYSAYNRTPALPAPTIRTAYDRWRTSATFVGGASATRAAAASTGLSGYGGPGSFAVTLAPGRYWFYASTTGDFDSAVGAVIPATTLREVTVVGPAARTAITPVAVARFAYSAATGRGTVTLPAVIPTHGYLLGIGVRGSLSTLRLHRLLPGVTDSELANGTCVSDGVPAQKQCFASPDAIGGGSVSGGASTLWFYSLPPGDYAVGQGGHDFFLDWYWRASPLQRVTVR